MPSQPSLLFFSPDIRRSVASGTRSLTLPSAFQGPESSAVAAMVESSYHLMVGVCGFRGFPDRIAVRFADMPLGADGSATLSSQGRVADIVLARNLVDRELDRALAHQLGHLVASGYPASSPAWWNEATARWIETKLVGPEREADLANRLLNPQMSLLDSQGMAVWLGFLEQRWGSDIVRRIWDEIAASPGADPVLAMAVVLDEVGTHLSDELEAFSGWLVAVDRRALAALPRLELARKGGTEPSRGHVLGPEPLGTAFLQFETAGVGGGLRIEILTEVNVRWTATALVVPLGSTSPLARIPLSAQAPGSATVVVPASDLAEVLIAVTNLDTGARMPLEYRVSIDDRYPFVLVGLSASATEGGVRLIWETDSEVDVQSWRILRMDEPENGFVRLADVDLPGAVGLGMSGGGLYEFRDDGLNAGRTYYYQLEAHTVEGLPASSQVVSVSLPY